MPGVSVAVAFMPAGTTGCFCAAAAAGSTTTARVRIEDGANRIETSGRAGVVVRLGISAARAARERSLYGALAVGGGARKTESRLYTSLAKCRSPSLAYAVK